MTSETFFGLSPKDRAEALGVAATESGRPIHILEKDVWVVWTLRALFDAPFGSHLVFKGGTSLSKAFNVINRFSEDIDVTYDIRAIAGDLIKDESDNPLPQSRSQGKKWSDAIRSRLPDWLTHTALPYLREKIAAEHLGATVAAENECLYIEYGVRTGDYGYVAPHVKVEFGARSTGEPSQIHTIACDAAPYLPGVAFPTASARVMRIERTFWEKLTAIHVFLLQGQIKDRLARHWYDVAQLDATGYADHALENREIAQYVAEHKKWFFSAKDAKGDVIDYSVAIQGGLILIPQQNALQALALDYSKMINDGLFLGAPPAFATVLNRCQNIQDRANAKALPKDPVTSQP